MNWSFEETYNTALNIRESIINIRPVLDELGIVLTQRSELVNWFRYKDNYISILENINEAYLSYSHQNIEKNANYTEGLKVVSDVLNNIILDRLPELINLLEVEYQSKQKRDELKQQILRFEKSGDFITANNISASLSSKDQEFANNYDEGTTKYKIKSIIKVVVDRLLQYVDLQFLLNLEDNPIAEQKKLILLSQNMLEYKLDEFKKISLKFKSINFNNDQILESVQFLKSTNASDLFNGNADIETLLELKNSINKVNFVISSKANWLTEIDSDQINIIPELPDTSSLNTLYIAQQKLIDISSRNILDMGDKSPFHLASVGYRNFQRKAKTKVLKYNEYEQIFATLIQRFNEGANSLNRYWQITGKNYSKNSKYLYDVHSQIYTPIGTI